MGVGDRRAPRTRRARLRSQRGHGGGRLSDPFDLRRFEVAQDGGTYARALDELRAGHKRSHWMWFIFPQLDGLGSSPTARRYALSGLPEARAYLEHPVLGTRLLACCEALLGLAGDVSAEAVFGSVDALKLRSCVTLFARAAPAQRSFEEVLTRFYGGEPDPATVRLLT